MLYVRTKINLIVGKLSFFSSSFFGEKNRHVEFCNVSIVTFVCIGRSYGRIKKGLGMNCLL